MLFSASKHRVVLDDPVWSSRRVDHSSEWRVLVVVESLNEAILQLLLQEQLGQFAFGAGRVRRSNSSRAALLR